MITLDIISDPICPWCYIGKTELDRALAAHPDHPFEVRWRPFQLNPDMPVEGMDRESYLEMKFGGPEAATEVYTAIAAAARESGLVIDFSRIARTPNTLNAHRLVRWASLEGVQSQVMDALFRLYFEEGIDISDRAVLLKVAGHAGLDPEVVGQLLDSEADAEDVQQEDRAAREIGVGGVPTFLVGGKYVIQGCQKQEIWTDLIEDILRLMAGDPMLRAANDDGPGGAGGARAGN